MKNFDMEYCLMTAVMSDNFVPYQSKMFASGRKPWSRGRTERIVFEMAADNENLPGCVRRRARERLLALDRSPYERSDKK